MKYLLIALVFFTMACSEEYPTEELKVKVSQRLVVSNAGDFYDGCEGTAVSVDIYLLIDSVWQPKILLADIKCNGRKIPGLNTLKVMQQYLKPVKEKK